MDKREQEYKLKDGRTIFKTHNGFKYFVEDKKGKLTEVTEQYYQQAFKNRIVNIVLVGNGVNNSLHKLKTKYNH